MRGVTRKRGRSVEHVLHEGNGGGGRTGRGGFGNLRGNGADFGVEEDVGHGGQLGIDLDQLPPLERSGLGDVLARVGDIAAEPSRPALHHGLEGGIGYLVNLGPGFLESVYEEALAVEFALSGIQFVRQYQVPLFYKDHQIGEHRLDFLVEARIVVELKAISGLYDIHFAVGRSYLKATQLQDGLLLNFATSPLTIKRFCRELPDDSEPDFQA